jgi:hypothetical protein
MFALLSLLSTAFAIVVKTIRDEKRAETAKLATEGSQAPDQPDQH